jgi:hypothetical protein
LKEEKERRKEWRKEGRKKGCNGRGNLWVASCGGEV